MKLLMVGQAPSRTGDRRKPCERAARKLARYARLDPDWFSLQFKKRNVFDRYQGSTHTRGDRFPIRSAQKRAARLLQAYPGHAFFLLGRNVARAFGLQNRDYFNPIASRIGDIVVIPHPSGLSRWWNNDLNVARYRYFIKRFLNIHDRV